MFIVDRLADLVKEARAEAPEREGFVILRPEPVGFLLERLEEHEFRLSGKEVERVVALNDVTMHESLSFIDMRLKRLGVTRALQRAGAQEGDVIHIGAFSFDYVPDL